jgi:hypothetical protein
MNFELIVNDSKTEKAIAMTSDIIHNQCKY